MTLVLSGDPRHPQIHFEHRHDRSSLSGMQFAQFPRLASSHFPLVGKGMTDEIFTTSEKLNHKCRWDIYKIIFHYVKFVSREWEREIMETLLIPSYIQIEDTSYFTLNKSRHMWSIFSSTSNKKIYLVPNNLYNNRNTFFHLTKIN